MKTVRRFLRALPFLALVATALVADAPDLFAADVPAAFEKARAFRDGDTFAAEFQTTAPWTGSDVQVTYATDGVQADISGAFLNKGKQVVRFDDRAFRSFQATQLDATTVRAKFYTKHGISGKAFDSRFRAHRSASGVTLEITGDPATAAAAKAVSDEIRNVAVTDEETSSEAMPAKLVAGGAAIAGTTPAAADSTGPNSQAAAPAELTPSKSEVEAAAQKAALAKLPESEIPVLQNTKDVKKSEGNGFFRIMMTLGVLATALGAAVFGLKRWTNKAGGKTKNHTQIKVLTSHHLGPKKNLMIVQVAGETLLIGVTDQNISMLKTLSLLDDEVPESVPRRFDHSMEDFIDDGSDHDDDEPIAMRGLSEIRDTVSTRLKNMRNL